MECTECGAILEDDETEHPNRNKSGEILCYGCFDYHYEYLCPLCGESFYEDFEQEISPKYFLCTEDAAIDLSIEPGIYEIVKYPYYADGLIEVQLYKDAVKWICEIPSDFNNDEHIGSIHFPCDNCMKMRRIT